MKKAIAPGQETNSPSQTTYRKDYSTTNVLSRLDRVKETGPDQWTASCPTSMHKHGDRSAGLSIKYADDGCILLYCHAGCKAESIVSAIGLSMRELFPPRDPKIVRFGHSRKTVGAAQLEAWIVWILVERLINNQPLTSDDKASFNTAVKRLARFGGML